MRIKSVVWWEVFGCALWLNAWLLWILSVVECELGRSEFAKYGGPVLARAVDDQTQGHHLRVGEWFLLALWHI